MDKIVAVSTTAYDGYSLEVALKQISTLGCKYVELAAISGIIEHLRPHDFNDDRMQYIKDVMSQYGLSSVGFSGHVDLADEGIVPVFKKRMSFAKKIGAKVINTNAGPREKLKTFYRNIVPIAEYAKDLGIIVALETHGDIIGSGEESRQVIDHIGSDDIKINYDFANAFYFSAGKIRPEEDFKYVLEHTVYLHIKDVALSQDMWRFTKIGEGIVDYQRIFGTLRERNLEIPMSLEFPLRLRGKKGGSLQKSEEKPQIEEINQIIKDSMGFIAKLV